MRVLDVDDCSSTIALPAAAGAVNGLTLLQFLDLLLQQVVLLHEVGHQWVLFGCFEDLKLFLPLVDLSIDVGGKHCEDFFNLK